jgi:antitoxin ParD1/3/4
MPTRLEQQAKEDEEKLEALRALAAEAFGSLDRGQGTALEGDQRLADFIGKRGRRAVARASRATGGECRPGGTACPRPPE